MRYPSISLPAVVLSKYVIQLLPCATGFQQSLPLFLPQLSLRRIPTRLSRLSRLSRHSSSDVPYGMERDDLNEESYLPVVEESDSEKALLARTAILCKERNLNLQCVKNARDLSSVIHSPIRPNRVYRTGKLSDSTVDDIKFLFDELEIKTVIDLRSPTELKEDENLHREQVFGNFYTIQWKEGKRTKYIYGDGHHTKFGGATQSLGLNCKISTVISEDDNNDGNSINEVNNVTNEINNVVSSSGADEANADPSMRKERHFVSLMDEFKYVRGTLSKFRKRDIARVLLKSPGAIWSRRVREGVKSVFLEEINDGGLPMLNELMLRMGAPGIRYVLDLVSDRDRHPVAFHCTAGKDRTGIITAIILAALGVPDNDIVEDYGLSANVYAEINDHTAMVGALSQRNLDPKTFLGAPPKVMQDTLDSIRENYGSVEGYLDWIGFGWERRLKLKEALMSD